MWPPLEYYAYSGLFNAITGAVISAVVLIKRPKLRLAHRFVACTILFFVWATFYFLWLCETKEATRAETFLRICMIPVTLFPAAFMHFAAELTDWSQGHRKIVIANYWVSIFFAGTIFTPLFTIASEPFMVFPFWLKAGPLFALHVLHFAGVLIYSHWLIYQRTKQISGRPRDQLLWVFWGFSTGFLAAGTNYFVWFRIPILPVLNPLTSLHIACVAYAIMQHQFLDIRVVIRRSLVYSILIACITAMYFVMVMLIERMFQGVMGYRSVAGTVAVSFLIAIFFNPLRSRIQAWVDQSIFHGTTEQLADERERLLEEIRRTEQMKAVSTLAAGLAHEIKNPLASIKTFTEHLNAKYEDPQFREKFKRIVGGEIERINHIVQQLLDYAKPQPKKVELINIGDVAQETVDLLESEFLKRQLSITCSGERDCRIFGDRKQLKQVLINLLLNAMDAISPGGQVMVSIRNNREHCELTVSDTGKGIQESDLPHVFKPFFSSKTTGTGLGLAVVQNIIQEHNGVIQIASEVGKGTIVTIRIPREPNYQ